MREAARAKPLPPTGAETGIDVGLKVFLVTADGDVVDDPRLHRRGERRETLELLESLSDEQLDQVSSHSPFGQGTVRDLFREIAWHEGQHVDWLTEAMEQP